MALPDGLITGRSVRLPTDWKRQPKPAGKAKGIPAGSGYEEGFLRLWTSLFPDLPVPVRNYRFHPKRKWTLDCAWPNLLVAVEIDGGGPGGGRHRQRAGFRSDEEKHRSLLAADWRVLRFMGDEMRERPVQVVEEVAVIVRRAIEEENASINAANDFLDGTFDRRQDNA